MLTENSKAKVTPVKGILNFFTLIIKGIFIVPQTQVRLLDFPYLLYTFHLFHRVKVNRISHYIGIPITMMTVYAIFMQWSFAAEAICLVVLALHLGMAIKHKLYALIPLVLGMHAAFWFGGTLLMPEFFAINSAWYTHPVVHLIFWPFLQYVTHAIEPFIPFPWSPKGQWTAMRDFHKSASIGRIALLMLCLPWHTFVEFISGHKNLFLMYFFLGKMLRIPMKQFEQVEERIDRELKAPNPIFAYEEFEAAMKR